MTCSENLVSFGDSFIIPIEIGFVYGNNRSMNILSMLLKRRLNSETIMLLTRQATPLPLVFFFRLG